MEGGDPVFLTLTVDHGRGAGDRITDEELTVDIRAADAGQVTDYDLSEPRIVLESRSSGNGQTNDIDLKRSSCQHGVTTDVGMEVSHAEPRSFGRRDHWDGNLGRDVLDRHRGRHHAKGFGAGDEAVAYPKIKVALGDDPETSVMNPGQTGTIMVSDLFTTEDGYTASYGVSVEGGAVSVTASSDSVSVTRMRSAIPRSPSRRRRDGGVLVRCLSRPSRTWPRITFDVMVVEATEPMPEPVPALPLIAQWLLGLGLMGGGARQLFRRRSQSQG